MKKCFYSNVIAAIAVFACCCSFSLHAQIKYALQESFENGIPDTWTQEYVVGQQKWDVEQGGSFPDGAYDGTSRVSFRNTTGSTQGFVTRLVTPVMDLTDIYQPVLVFAQAREHSLGDVDELRIYYRSSPDDAWVLYDDNIYTERQKEWNVDTIPLVAVTDSYQLAFEATDKFGKGVVLDYICVRPMPQCTQPEITVLSDLTATSFKIGWFASFDSDSCRIKLFEGGAVGKDNLETAEAVVDTVIVGAFECLFENLKVNTTYYVYVKSYCIGESSEWSEDYSVYTQASVSIPYTVNFDREYRAGWLVREDTWTYGNSWPNAEYTFCPHINSNDDPSKREDYSKNGTSCMVFTGSNNSTSTITGGQICYTVTPELEIEDIRTLQLTFWGSCGKEGRGRLIVGVATDPTDPSTFVPIDTAVVTSGEFGEFIVTFENYEGNGKYIAFVSNFQEDNIFYMDDVAITEKPSCPKVSKLTTTGLFHNEVTLHWKDLLSEKYEVILSNKYIENPSSSMQSNGDTVIINRTETTNSCYIDGLEGNVTYYAYVRAICSEGESGAWSNAYSFTTPCEAVLPMHFSFEEEEGYYINGTGSSYKMTNCLTAYSYHSVLPYCYKCSGSKPAYDGDYVLWLFGKPDSRARVVFPPVENVQNLWMNFIASSYFADDKPVYIEIGVMDDVQDPKTFTALDTLALTPDYDFYEVSFKDYKGSGNNIAILYSDLNDDFYYAYIDMLNIQTEAACSYPHDIQVTTTSTTAEFSWTAGGEKTQLVVMEETDEGVVDVVNTIIENSGNKYLVEGLKPNLQAYTYKLRTICGTDTSGWTIEKTFSTECQPTWPFPFSENFESCQATSTAPSLPVCWDTEYITYYDRYSTTYYPSVSSTGGFDGSKALYLTSSTYTPVRADYVVLPDIDFEKIQDAQISFMLKQSMTDTEVEVGVISDITDTTTFEVVAKFVCTANNKNEWREVVVPFDSYTGTSRRIMIRSVAGGTSYNYVDNIYVGQLSSCLKPTDLMASNATPTTIELSWTKGNDETQWDLLVLKYPVDAKDILPASEATAEVTAYHGVVDKMPYTLETGLEPNTPYYYYLRSICGVGDTTDWTMNYGEFRTTCVGIDMPYIETFEDGDTNFECWQGGVLEGTTNPPSISSNLNSKRLYIFNSTSSDGTYAILPNFNIESITDYQMSFDISTGNSNANNAGKIIVGVITNPSDILSFMPIDTIEAQYNEYIRHTVRFDEYDGDYKGEYGKYIMFYSSFGLEGVINNIYIDDIVVDTIGACPEIVKLNFDSIGTYDVHFSWKNEADSYVVKVASEEMTVDELNEADNAKVVFEQVGVKDGKLSVENLSRLTTYYIYVQSVCDGNKTSAWSYPFKFTTECPYEYEIPYKESFDDYGTGTVAKPSCWTTYYGKEGIKEPGSSMYCNASYNNSINGTASLYVYSSSTSGYGAMAVSPRLAVSDISTMMLSFYATQTSATSYPRMVVGLAKEVPDSLSFTSFMPIDTICLPIDNENLVAKEWYKYEYDLSYLDTLQNKADYKHIVLLMVRDLNRSSATATTGATGTIYVDDVELYPIPTCFRPEGLKVVDRTDSSVKLAWEGESDNYNVTYGPTGFDPSTGGSIVASPIAEAEVSGLLSNTEYEFYVQSDCGDEDGVSTWFGPIRIKTLATVVSQYPYTNGFEDETENSKWELIQLNELVNKWYIGNAINNGGTNSLYISNDNGQTAEYTISSGGSAWAVRPFKLEKGVYDISYDWQCYGEKTSDFVRICLIPSINTLTSSVGTAQGKIVGETSTTMSSVATHDGMIDVSQSPDKKYLSGSEGVVTKDTSIVIRSEVAGTYWLAIYWRNDASGGDRPNPSAMIDNISIEKQSCPAPVDISVLDITDTEGTIVWTSLNDACSEWEVKLTDKELADLSLLDNPENVLGSQTVSQTKCSFKDLTESTTYYVYVRSACGGNYSEWSQVFAFTTACAPMSIGASWDFEAEEGNFVGSSTKYLSPLCWVVGNKNSDSYTYIPYQIENTGTYTYGMSNGSHTGSTNTQYKDKDYQHALYFNTTSSNDGAYAILPYVEGDLDAMQVRFYARAGYAKAERVVAENGYKINTTYVSSTYAHSIIVGMVSIYDDISTFVPLDTIDVTPNLSTSQYATVDNNYLFDEIVVPLKKDAGRYVAFLSEFGKNNKVYIDNVTIEEMSGCYAPIIDVKASGSTSADVSWRIYGENTTRWVVTAATDENMEYTVVSDTVDMKNTHTLNNLEPATTYYVTVQQLCEESQSEDEYRSMVKVVTTYNVIPFNEYFSSATHTPAGFNRYSQKFDDQVVDMSTWTNTNNATSGWVRDDDGNGIANAHQRVRVTSTANYWLVTPTIDLSDQTNNVWLTFDMALTESQSANPPVSAGIDWTDDKFMVVVSTDGGTTWNKNNAVIWSNDPTADYMLKDIPNVGTNYRIPLDKYKGQKIAIAFFATSTTNAVTFDLHIDNIHVNRYVVESHSEDICPLHDYENYGFVVDYTLLKAGETYFTERYVQSNNSLVADSLVTLELSVGEIKSGLIKGEICEGDTYEEAGFVASLPGEYKQKLTASNGCDSISVLQLSVIPSIRTEILDTICQGAPYYFNGKEYNRSGIYNDTLSSVVTGCDSIVTLYLKVNEAIRKTVSYTLCFGDEYDFNGQKLTTSGTYLDTLQTATGCDSIVTLQLTALPELKTIFTETVCPGETYTGHGFVGVPALAKDYERVEKTSNGCDSTIILRLTVLDSDTTYVRDTISTTELPYNFHGKEYGVGTPEGVYEDTILVSGGGDCESVLIATLVITSETGIFSTEYGKLQILPTYINKGESVRIVASDNFTTSLRVDVYNMLGKLVYSNDHYEPGGDISVFSISGAYLIRGINQQGEMMHGQVLVK